uniref:Uncharacterized protein n=1 Tax=Nelumbo nucifera TaxID=4432 RepID=A0A822YDV7_NELNU|nr:TPA_asm: hypothetical protein HUJ06_009403 [Nelumbo nucifera]
MACGTVFRSVFMTEAWRPFHQNRASALLPLTLLNAPLKPKWSFRVGVTIRDLHRRRGGPFNCFNDETLSSSSQDDQAPPQEAVLKAISEVSKTEGRIGQTTNVVIGGTITDDSTNKWLALDQKVNSYPTVRGFTAIGTGCDDFVQAMVVAIESVLQYPILEVDYLIRFIAFQASLRNDVYIHALVGSLIRSNMLHKPRVYVFGSDENIGAASKAPKWCPLSVDRPIQQVPAGWPSFPMSPTGNQ